MHLGSKITHLLKYTLFVHVSFSLYQQCKNSLQFKRWVILQSIAFQFQKLITNSTKLQKI